MKSDMLKKTVYLLTVFFVAFSLPLSAQQTRPVRTIIIDPGHGGSDQGAAGLISTEAQLNLAIAKKLGEQIEKEIPNVKILFTRTTDIFPGNSPTKKDGDRYRATFANQSKADLFISIHCNSAGKAAGGWYEKRVSGYTNKTKWVGKGKKRRKTTVKVPEYETVYVPNEARGTETFIWAAHETNHKGQFVADQAAEYASVEMEGGPESNDPVMDALKLIYTKKFFIKSMQLAEMVQQQFEQAGRVNRGVKQRNDVGIWVLHATGMPSVLVETGFISNKEEEQYLNSEEGQTQIATQITGAVKQYFSATETPRHITAAAGPAPSR